MQHIVLCTPCIIFMLVSHTCIFVIDPTEPELEELPELAPAEETNPEQDEGKPWCLTTFLEFCLSLYIIYDSCMCIRLKELN
jgi:hypothetical protein